MKIEGIKAIRHILPTRRFFCIALNLRTAYKHLGVRLNED